MHGLNLYFDIHILLRLIEAALIIGIAILVTVFIMQKKIVRERKYIDELKKETEISIASQKRFLANMSHEIRTPINTIIGLNEINLRGDMTEDQRENCSSISQASKMLLAIINDILDFSKIESGKMDIIPEEYETAELLNDIVNMNISKIKAKGLDFDLYISPDMPVKLYGDCVRIKQILINLFTNAVKYTERGKVTLSFKFEEAGDDSIVLVGSVQDTGKGMRPESMIHLFDAFQRVDESENRYIEGTGLGLAITKQLVDLMGGTIAVDSVYKMGSVFTVKIPQKVMDKTPMGDVASALKNKNTVKSQYNAKFTAPQARVLIVDDNRLNLTVAAKLLTDTKMLIDVAESGKAALELTALHKYNIILMDHQMPEMDGIETLNRIRNQEGGFCNNVPVIALTANAGTDMEELYKTKGFQAYIVKPINSAILESTVLKFLNQDLVNISELLTEDELEFEVGSRVKKRFSVTTDSSCGLSSVICHKYGIRKIPCYIDTNIGRFKDQEEVFMENLLENDILKRGSIEIIPSSVSDYEAVFANELQGSEYVIHVAQSSKIDEFYSNAKKAALSFDHVVVIDSKHISSGMGLLCIKVAQMAVEGKSIEEIKTETERLISKISNGYLVTEPNYIYAKTNRAFVNRLRMILESVEAKIELKIVKGEFVPRRITMGSSEDAYRKYIKNTVKKYAPIIQAPIFYNYSGIPAKLRKEHLDYIRSLARDVEIIEQPASASVLSLCGSAGLGIMFMKD